MKNIVFIVLMSCTIGAAQIKQIQFDPNVKYDMSDIKLNFKPIKGTTKDIKVKYKTAFFDGLKPGYLNNQGLPSFFEGEIPDEKALKGVSTVAAAQQYISYALPYMGLVDQDITFQVMSEQKDELGMDHIRFAQVVKGIPIYGAEVIVHGKGGRFNFMNGNYQSSIKINDVTPSMSGDEAMSICVKDRGASVTYKNFMGPLSKLMNERKQLVIYPNAGSYTLAYHITSYKNLAERWEYFIDAKTGQIIHKHESLCKVHNHQGNGHLTTEVNPPLDGKATANALDLFDISRSLNTYQVGSSFYMIDGSRDIFSSQPAQLPDDPSGVIWTIDAFNTSPQKDNFKYDHVKSTNNSWSSKAAVSAHYNGGKAFEYYRNVHNRKAIDGQGGNIISMINVADDNGQSMGNAFWNGQAMFYGNGDSAFKPLARGLDVAGHEMTHGVVQSTANLEYEGESGALNESFADVFGALIDRDDWLIGEDVVKNSAFPSGALRSLEDPHNGASTNNFNDGWQPRIFSERYKGAEDNGGVHINSGIPNWAFFKFASAVGKDKAEKVYYRALSSYLTKSSKFVDCRVAIVKSCTDLFGAAEVAAAKKAFDEVEIFGDSSGDYEVDVDENPGQDFVLVTNLSDDGLYLFDGNGQSLGQISQKGVLSKPSISDDGQNIVFIGKDNRMNYISIDWTTNPATVLEDVIQSSPIWRNVIISKDGSNIAALTSDEKNEIILFDESGNPETFTLYNPTFTNGQETGDVNFADAMEFDITGEYIMYDAENEINSLSSGSISYWDISFINVWDNDSDNFGSGKIEKLFSTLPDDVSVGNPAFSKNSPYIISFDYINEDGSVDIVGANIEQGELELIFSNGETLGYPNYSTDDKKLVFDALSTSNQELVGITELKPSKIEPSGSAAGFIANRHWAVWFSNGKRKLSSIGEVNIQIGNINIVQNPVKDLMYVKAELVKDFSGRVVISDIVGKQWYSQSVNLKEGIHEMNIPVSNHPLGSYVLSMISDQGVISVHYVKVD